MLGAPLARALGSFADTLHVPMVARALALRGWKTLFLGEFTLASARHAAAWARERRRSDGRALDEPCRARPHWSFRATYASPQAQRRWLRAEGRPATYP
eukprot:2458722-Alexandrium_andersonii.AAC.1